MAGRAHLCCLDPRAGGRGLQWTRCQEWSWVRLDSGARAVMGGAWQEGQPSDLRPPRAPGPVLWALGPHTHSCCIEHLRRALTPPRAGGWGLASLAAAAWGEWQESPGENPGHHLAWSRLQHPRSWGP